MLAEAEATRRAAQEVEQETDAARLRQLEETKALQEVAERHLRDAEKHLREAGQVAQTLKTDAEAEAATAVAAAREEAKRILEEAQAGAEAVRAEAEAQAGAIGTRAWSSVANSIFDDR